MTTHRIRGRVAFSCDGCPETHESETDVFRDALEEARAAGFVVAEVRGEYHHYCAACAKERRID